MIKLVNIDRTYQIRGERHHVLRRVRLDVKQGEFLTIMGPSGAGKSSLLNILGMLDSEWSGEYYFDDAPVHTMRTKDRIDLHKQNIGFVFQQYHLLDNLSVEENLDIPLSYRNMRRAERQAAVAETLDRFNIVAKKDLYPNQLSGGQQQLVGIARAVISKPKLILADEPTGNLHTSQGCEVMELFKELNRQGTTIVQVTHSESNASYGDRVVRLVDGWMLEHDAQGGSRTPRVVTML